MNSSPKAVIMKVTSLSENIDEFNSTKNTTILSNPTELFNSNFEDAAKHHKIVENTPAIIFTTILMLIGIPGNTIVCTVYRKWSNSTSTRVFILSLAILDLLNCVITSPTEISMLAYPLDFDSGVVCKLSRFSTYFCNTSSALIMVAVAADRYRRICTPNRIDITPRRARVIVLILVAVSLFFSWPALLLYGTRQFYLNDHGFKNIFARNCLLERRFIQTPFPVSYFAFHCVSTIAIFTIVTVLYIFVGVSIFQRWKFRKQFIKPTVEFHLQIIRNQSRDDINETNITRDSSNEDNGTIQISQSTTHVFPKGIARTKSNINIEKTTLMLFLATLTYILSFLPFLGLAIDRSLHPGRYHDMSISSEMAFQIFFRSYLINSALDPIIYSFCNDQFRSECRKILRL